MAQPNSEYQDPTDTPSAAPTAFQASRITPLILSVSYPDGNPVQPIPVPHLIEQNLYSYPVCKSEQSSQPLQLFGFPIPT